MRLGDERGAEGITMSGLAKSLGSGTMSLYRYVESRDDLLVLAADRALAPRDAPRGETWREQLRAWVDDLRSAYERHPWLTSIPVGTEPLLPAYVRRLECGLACLEALSLTPSRAVTVLTMLWTYTRGDVEQSAHLAAAADQAPEAFGEQLAARLRALGDGTTPHLLAALEDDSADDVDEFDAAIELVFDGLSCA